MKTKKRIISAIIISAMLAMTAAGCSTAKNDTASEGSAPADTKPTTSTSIEAADKTGEAEAPATAPAGDTYSTSESVKGFASDGVTNSVRGDTAEGEAAPRAAAKAPEKTAAAEIADTYDSVDDDAISVPDTPTDVMPEEPPVTEPSEMPQSGLLTAGEWNDNKNWGFFTNLVNTELISFPSYNIDPRFRTAVTVTDKDGKPVVNAAARLIGSDGKVVWSAVTGKDGIAYLFGQNESDGARVEIESKGTKQEYELKAAQTDTQSEVKSTGRDISVTFDGSYEPYKKTDIMFILDTTGSMGDEMLFLQSEFTGITQAIGTENTRYSVNFYRDEGDEYVTKCNDFTDDISSLQQKLNNENANGGGDLPEAVDRILQETINTGSWQEDSVKLAFLILDAPPHDEKAAQTAVAVREAAKKGIRIIPVISSNSDRNTELFGRAAAIVTGGTYVFLTDDSGIGGKHLEPIIGEHKVEKLYDLIIRVINEYKQ